MEMAKEAVKILAVRSSTLRSHPAEPKIEHTCARALDPAIERTCDRAHALLACEVRVTLAAIANLLHCRILERLQAIDLIPRDRAQPMRSSAPNLTATLILPINRTLSVNFVLLHFLEHIQRPKTHIWVCLASVDLELRISFLHLMLTFTLLSFNLIVGG